MKIIFVPDDLSMNSKFPCAGFENKLTSTSSELVCIVVDFLISC